MRRADASFTNDVLGWMQLSIDLGKRSISEGGTKPNVGVVIVRDGTVLGASYRSETGPGNHAEYGLIEKLGKSNLAGTTLFTTLEPCSRRNAPKRPCAHHLVEAGVHTVYIGMYDPNPVIYREGWRILRDAGVVLRDYPDALRSQIETDNAPFVESFKASVGQRGTGTFDYTQNGGKYELRHEDLIISTRWVESGADSIQALDYDQHVAVPRYARDFGEIDNPGSLNWSNYTARIAKGEIVAFRTPQAYALVKITNVFAGPHWGADHTAIHFSYELRRRN